MISKQTAAWPGGGTVLLVAALAGCAAGTGAAPHSFPAPPSSPERGSAAIQIESPLLEGRMASLSRRSAIWRAGLDTIRASGLRVVVAEAAQVPERVPELRGYRAEHIGEVVLLRDEDGAIIGAVVSVDVPRLRALVQSAGLPASVLARDLDRILIHEIYGHVVPLSQSRTFAGGCPDPAPDEPALSSCAIRRENRIRAELGMERRTTYDIRGLAVGRWLEDRGRAGPADRRDER